MALRPFRRPAASAPRAFLLPILIILSILPAVPGPGPLRPAPARGGAADDPLDGDGNGVEDLIDAWAEGRAGWDALVARCEADAEPTAAKAGRPPAGALLPGPGPLAQGLVRVLRLGGGQGAMESARARAAAGGGEIRLVHRIDRFGGVDVLAADAGGLRALRDAHAGGRLVLDRDGTPALDQSSQLTAAGLARSGPWRLEGDWTASVAILDSGCDTAHDDLGDYSHDNRDGPPPAVGDALDWSPAAAGWPTFLDYKVIGWRDVTDDFPLAAGPWDYHWHGTALAGVVAAQGDIDLRYRGLAPSARLTIVKFYDFDGVWRQWAGDFLAACDWLLDNREQCRVRVALCAVNWDADLGITAALAALRDAGVLPVCAMGNDGPDAPPGYPARSPEALSVGAVNDAAVLARFSTRGAAGSGKPDLLAPGGGLLPAAGRVTTADNEPDDSYSGRWGTSIAAAHVAAGAFLLLEAARKEGCPAPAGRAEVDLVAALLLGTAAPVFAAEGPGGAGVEALLPWPATPDTSRGWGLLQVAAAAEAAVSPLAGGGVAVDSLGGTGGRRVLARRLALPPARDILITATPTGDLDVVLEVHDTRAFTDPGSGLTRLLRDEAGRGGAERAVFRTPPAGAPALVAVKRRAGSGRVTLRLTEPGAAPAVAWQTTLGGALTGWPVPARLGPGQTPALITSGLTAVDPQARLVNALELGGGPRAGWPALVYLPTTLVGNLTAPLAWDLDGAAGDEVVVASAYGKVYFVAPSGLVTPFDVAPANVPLTAPVGRERADGGREVVVVSGQGTLARLGPAGAPLGTTPLGAVSPRAPAAGELDGLPGEEVVVAFAGGLVCAVGDGGAIAPGWPVTIGAGARAPVLVDLDGDGRHEVVCARLAGAALDQLELRVLRGTGEAGPGDGTLVAVPAGGAGWVAISEPAALARAGGVGPAVVLQGVYRVAGSGALDPGGYRLALVRFGLEGALATTRGGCDIRGLAPTGEVQLRWAQLAPPLVREAGDGAGPEAETLVSLGWEETIPGTPNLRGGFAGWLVDTATAPPLAQRLPVLAGYPQASAPVGTWAALLATPDGAALVRIVQSGAQLVAQPVGPRRGEAPLWTCARGDARNSAALPLAVGEPTAAGPLPGLTGPGLRLRPNPAPGRVEVAWRGVAPGAASLEVYDLRGRRLRRLALGAVVGEGAAVWDGRAEDGRPVAAGAYLVTLRTAAGVLRARAVVAR